MMVVVVVIIMMMVVTIMIMVMMIMMMVMIVSMTKIIWIILRWSPTTALNTTWTESLRALYPSGRYKNKIILNLTNKDPRPSSNYLSSELWDPARPEFAPCQPSYIIFAASCTAGGR